MNKKLKEYQTKAISLKDSKYPLRLIETKSPPKELYYKGNLDVLESRLILGVVGSRKPTEYGLRSTREVVAPLVRNGVAIVSGLAYGIDVLAHKITLEFGGGTIAVMAGGIDAIYPPSHEQVALEILQKGGLILSEHPEKTPYLRQHFPARNRIIAGLSNSILVVEAQKKSGSLITAKFAFKERKKVFSVPGSIFSPESEGTNSLFKEGALPATKSEDIFCFYADKNVKAKQEIINKTEEDLDEEEKNIFQKIPPETSISLNDLIRKSGWNSAKVIVIITQLELRGLIKEVGGGRYTRNF